METKISGPHSWTTCNARFGGFVPTLLKYRVDPDHIGAFGHSAGAQLAALLGMEDTRDNSDATLAKYSSRVQAVVEVSGPTDFTTHRDADDEVFLATFFGGDYAQRSKVWQDASPVFHVSKNVSPFLIMHGTQDADVPIAQSQELADKLRQAGASVKFVTVEDVHTFQTPEARKRLALETQAFFTQYLRPGDLQIVRDLPQPVFSAHPVRIKSHPLKEKMISMSRSAGTYAIFETSEGTIVCRLFEKDAPKTVANFVELADGKREWTHPSTRKKSKDRLYDGTIFHRVIPNFMIQGGDPLGTGTGGPGYQFEDETKDSPHKFDKPGKLAMANAGPNTNGSQFFITLAPTTWLTGKHTIFGEVVEGQDVAEKIVALPRNRQDRPNKDIVVKKVTIEKV